MTTQHTISDAPVLSGPKRQHFLPAFYLEGFRRDHLVAVLDRRSGLVRRQTPQNTAVVGHMYTLEDGDGRKRFEAEALLSKVEDAAAPAIAALASGQKLSTTSRGALSVFAATAYLRTPQNVDGMVRAATAFYKKEARDALGSEADVIRHITDHELVTGERFEVSASDIADFVNGDDYEVRVRRDYMVAMAMAMITPLANIFRECTWEISFIADKRHSFITADSPLTLFYSRNHPANAAIGLGSPGAVKVMPLTAKIALIIHGPGSETKYTRSSMRRVHLVNEGIAANSDRFLIGRDTALLRSIAKRTSILDRPPVDKFSKMINDLGVGGEDDQFAP